MTAFASQQQARGHDSWLRCPGPWSPRPRYICRTSPYRPSEGGQLGVGQAHALSHRTRRLLPGVSGDRSRISISCSRASAIGAGRRAAPVQLGPQELQGGPLVQWQSVTGPSSRRLQDPAGGLRRCSPSIWASADSTAIVRQRSPVRISRMNLRAACGSDACSRAGRGQGQPRGSTSSPQSSAQATPWTAVYSSSVLTPGARPRAGGGVRRCGRAGPRWRRFRR